MSLANQYIVKRLQQQILQWEGYKPISGSSKQLVGLGPMEDAFPNGVFPVGTIHEMICGTNEQAAASGGMVAGILSVLMRQNGICIWIGRGCRLFAPALVPFGVSPHRVIFINLNNDKDALWVMEEALKCGGITAVVGELQKMDFRQSQRFQRAVEQSHVTGFVLRNAMHRPEATACAARWEIKSLPSITPDDLPGPGFQRWKVDLTKVRNGQTGSWVVEFKGGCFVPEQKVVYAEERQVG